MVTILLDGSKYLLDFVSMLLLISEQTFEKLARFKWMVTWCEEVYIFLLENLVVSFLF